MRGEVGVNQHQRGREESRSGREGGQERRGGSDIESDKDRESVRAGEGETEKEGMILLRPAKNISRGRQHKNTLCYIYIYTYIYYKNMLCYDHQFKHFRGVFWATPSAVVAMEKKTNESCRKLNMFHFSKTRHHSCQRMSVLDPGLCSMTSF